ncbi:biotin transport system substrate-specific component [Streptoalloteichus tenebrarius]|uniref:Biotin transporter n=1 Tax=Streptoalloteichus tenebrarius (strain ATCC 17920 / DSM 40477 / JCM 4838 / CBS 697.72 / NBRC 16177 / NCIMB 11028 / NRRL B-12390 / A12253. 1 / ISP 5477) TaxID=1933 RepID=A0ABT1I3M2_STRSD|nr:biotin transporter BioY [Streptoalloteichus tenebrarius]MCP2262395.1 biotin transport system substrate-specific component [Streptoalloteichus tenebrarius]
MSLAAHPVGLARPRAVLADLVPGAAVRDAVLVLAGAGLTGLLAQVALPIPGSPVPVTAQTLGALLVGAGLGWQRGFAAMALYLLAGVAGVPWFSAGSAGWGGASFGYVVGFLVAGTLVGALAARGGDRTPLRTAGTMVLGNLAIYAVGVPWLMAVTGFDLGTALAKGMLPFLVGDALKIALAAGLLPGAWALVRRFQR